MTDQQARAYLSLLCYSWLETPRATLPNDDIQLAQLVHLSLDEWDRIKAPILAKFVSGENGRIYNERLMQESDYCDKKSFAGRAGWAKQNGSKKASRTAAKKKQPIKHK